MPRRLRGRRGADRPALPPRRRRAPRGDARRPRPSRPSRARSRSSSRRPTRTSSGARSTARDPRGPRERPGEDPVPGRSSSCSPPSGSARASSRAGCGSGSARGSSASRSSRSASRRTTGCSGPTAGSTTFLPGWEAIRTPGPARRPSPRSAWRCSPPPGRSRCSRRSRARLAAGSRDAGPRGASLATGALAALLALADRGRGTRAALRSLRRPGPARGGSPPPSVADVPAPQLHLPAETPEDNRRYLLWSTDGFPDDRQRPGEHRPDEIEDLILAMRRFPDAATVERLRELGVRSVILHTDRVAGSPQAAAAFAPVAGLGLTLERRGPLLVYELGSGASRLRERGGLGLSPALAQPQQPQCQQRDPCPERDQQQRARIAVERLRLRRPRLSARPRPARPSRRPLRARAQVSQPRHRGGADGEHDRRQRRGRPRAGSRARRC